MATATQDTELRAAKATIADLKAKVSALDNARNKLSMDLGTAQKDAKAHEQLKEDHAELKSQLDAANAKIGNLEADLKSAASKGGRDNAKLDAATKLAEAVKTLAG